MQRHEYDTQQLNFGALLVTTEHGEQKSKGCGDENKPINSASLLLSS
jgi:hypothetical protein